jgi:multidrug efflux pump subunit AcrB
MSALCVMKACDVHLPAANGTDQRKHLIGAGNLNRPQVMRWPLGLAGVAGALLLLNRPFGFVALLGLIALMGMIQRNSVILIDLIEQDRADGVAAWDAIVESAVRRLRPIVLTAAAAVLAMIPLSRSVF